MGNTIVSESEELIASHPNRTFDTPLCVWVGGKDKTHDVSSTVSREVFQYRRVRQQSAHVISKWMCEVVPLASSAFTNVRSITLTRTYSNRSIIKEDIIAGDQSSANGTISYDITWIYNDGHH